MQWSVSKQNKLPLYVQLRDLVTYYISTGQLKDKQQLPTIHALAEQLGVTFETVRKAYKELEREGLASSERGRGTFVNGHKATAKANPEPHRDRKSELTESMRRTVRELSRAGISADDILGIVAQVFHEARAPFVIFAECNTYQNRELSKELREYLGIEVRPVLLKELKQEIAKLDQRGETPAAVITTGFHVNQVRKEVGDLSLQIEFVVNNMSPETRRALESYDKRSRFAFVCRDEESLFFKDLLKSELGIPSEIPYCLFREKSKLATLVKNSDVLLVTPTVYQQLKESVGPKTPLFNVLDQLDPVSLRMVKDSITERLEEQPTEDRRVSTQSTSSRESDRARAAVRV